MTRNDYGDCLSGIWGHLAGAHVANVQATSQPPPSGEAKEALVEILALSFSAHACLRAVSRKLDG